MKNVTILLISVLFVSACYAGGLSDSTLKAINEKLTTFDTSLGVLKHDLKIQNVYMNLVERTNQQLSYSQDFSAIFISALGVLFAVASIVAGVLLYRQSKEYKSSIDNVLKNANSLVDSSIARYDSMINDFVSENKKSIDILIENYQQSMESGTKEHKEKIEKEIARLNEFKHSLSASTSSANSIKISSEKPPFYGSSIELGRIHKCSNCGFEISVPSPAIGPVTSGIRAVICPKCNKLESI